MHSPTSCFMNNSTGSLMVNTTHKISCLCECIGQGNILTSPPTPLHLIHSVLHSPSLFNFPPFHLCPWFPVFTISPPSPPSVLFSLGATVQFLITPFIKKHKYIKHVLYLFIFLCHLSRNLSPFCSAVSCYLSNTLVFPLFCID